MSSGSRHARPILVREDAPAIVLERFVLGTSADDDRRELFIQDLVHNHPEVLPMADIEPAFSPLVSICRELPTSAGYLDNLWLTPNGGIVLGECKLFKNPQARREVVAQALDYARAISRWHYEDLEAAVRKALRAPAATIWDLVKDQTDLDEAQFADAVERRLRVGQLLLLVIGDGIQEGVEALTAHLQLHAGLHAGLALVDLSVWRGLEGLLVVPRVPMKTLLVERGIVVVADGVARVEAPTTRTSGAGAATARAVTASEPEFYEQLAAKRPDLPVRLKGFVDELAELGIQPEFGKSLILRWHPSPDLPMSAGYVEAATGKFWNSDAWYSANRVGKASAAEAYQQELASITGGQLRRYEKSPPQVLDANGKGLDVGQLLDAAPRWKAALAQFISAMASAE